MGASTSRHLKSVSVDRGSRSGSCRSARLSRLPICRSTSARTSRHTRPWAAQTAPGGTSRPRDWRTADSSAVAGLARCTCRHDSRWQSQAPAGRSCGERPATGALSQAVAALRVQAAARWWAAPYIGGPGKWFRPQKCRFGSSVNTTPTGHSHAAFCGTPGTLRLDQAFDRKHESIRACQSILCVNVIHLINYPTCVGQCQTVCARQLLSKGSCASATNMPVKTLKKNIRHIFQLLVLAIFRDYLYRCRLRIDCL